MPEPVTMARPLGSAPRSETSRIDSRCIELDTVRPQLCAGDEPPNRAKADVEPLSRLFGAQLFGEFVLLFGGGHFATPLQYAGERVGLFRGHCRTVSGLACDEGMES